MPGSMIHLLTAYKIRPDGSDLFYIGNIAPDAVADWKQKEITHFRDLPDRLPSLTALAESIREKDDFTEGILVHLFLDWKWDTLIRGGFEAKTGADWFPRYREELSLAGSYAFHHTPWAESVWKRMDLCSPDHYKKTPGAAKEQVKNFIDRNHTWHTQNNIGPSEFFTPSLIDDFTTQTAKEYTEWRIL